MENYLPQVREQYEDFPYPPRLPEDEKKCLVTTWLDSLFMINHYCCEGAQTFANGFRVLVAGGGTGDGTIYLAEQLRNTDAEVVHLDISAGSIEIARKRAEIRDLTNIRWINDSLLNLPQLGLGYFGYINCSGVLHHLSEPDAGLCALKSVLAPGASIGLMVYGTYGRTGVYQMQKLLRLINEGTDKLALRLENAKQVVGAIPASNWFAKGGYLDDLSNDAGIVDLLLHAQDISYTVEELYVWLHDQHGFHLEFSGLGRRKSAYLPDLVVAPRQAAFLDQVRARPLRQQQAIAELLGGALDIHSLYLTPGRSRVAPYGDGDYIPFFCHEPVSGPEISAIIHRNTQQPFVLSHSHTGITTTVDHGRYGKFVLKYLDGKRTFAEIFSLVRREDKFRRAPPSDETLFDDFKGLYIFFNAIERLLLKRR